MTTANKWTRIYESQPYQAEIYDNCTTRVYQHDDNPAKIKLEVDGTKWVGNSGGFYVHKYFVEGEQANKLIAKIAELDNDEASETDVDNVIESIAE